MIFNKVNMIFNKINMIFKVIKYYSYNNIVKL